jgi:hypothetical protein
VDFDDIDPNTDISNEEIQGITFEPGGAAPLIVVKASDTYTPLEGWIGAGAIRRDNRLFATTQKNVLSPGGVELAPGPNSALEDDNITLTLSEPVSAIGFDILYQALDGYSYTSIQILDQDDNELYYNSQIPIPGDAWTYPEKGVRGGTVFVGFLSDSVNIAKIIIEESDYDNQNPDSNIGLDSIRIRVYQPNVKVTGGGWFTDPDYTQGHNCSFGIEAMRVDDVWTGHGSYMDKEYRIKAILTVETGLTDTAPDGNPRIKVQGTARVYIDNIFWGETTFRINLVDAQVTPGTSDKLAIIIESPFYVVWSGPDGLDGGEIVIH